MNETFSIQLPDGSLTIDLINYPRLLVADKKELNNYQIKDQTIVWPDLGEIMPIWRVKQGKPSKETAASFVKWLRKREC